MKKIQIWAKYLYYKIRQYWNRALIYPTVVAWPTMLFLMFKLDSYVPNMSVYILEHSAWLYKNTEAYPIVKMLYYLGIGFAFLFLTFGFFGVMIAFFVRYVSLDKISLTSEEKNQFKQLEIAEHAKLEKTYMENKIKPLPTKTSTKSIHKI